MSVKYKHSDVYALYFCTFTCYNWMPLIEITNSYDKVYEWFSILRNDNIETVAYVIMPNHLHCIFYFHKLLCDIRADCNIINVEFFAHEVVFEIVSFSCCDLLRQ